MPLPRHAALSSTLLTCLLCSAPTDAIAADLAADPAAASGTSTPAAPGLPLRSQEALNAWLRANTGKPTPLDALSAGGRERFLAGLDFGEEACEPCHPMTSAGS